MEVVHRGGGPDESKVGLWQEWQNGNDMLPFLFCTAQSAENWRI